MGRLIDVWGLDIYPEGDGKDAHGDYPDCFIIVIGHDDNGDHKLQAGEIDFPIGQCIYHGGLNNGWVDAGTNITHWINMEPGPGSTTTKKDHYIYNPNTDILKVWRDDDGSGPHSPALIYSGPPNSYPDWVW